MAPLTENFVATAFNSTLAFAVANFTQTRLPAPVASNINVPAAVNVDTSGNSITTSRSNGMATPSGSNDDDTKSFNEYWPLIVAAIILFTGVVLLMIRTCTTAAHHRWNVTSSHHAQLAMLAGPKHPRIAKLLASIHFWTVSLFYIITIPIWGPFYLCVRKNRAGPRLAGGSIPVRRDPTSQTLERQRWTQSLGLGATNVDAPRNMTSWYTRQPDGSCMLISERFRMQATAQAVIEGRALDEEAARGESTGPVMPQAALPPYTSVVGRSRPVVVGLQTPPPSYTRRDPSL
ncbi:hypothetical protein MN608_03005 [Microdochium nivale]|nr:hypothetical protein MN608_03005 [Microdochium nivale]